MAHEQTTEMTGADTVTVPKSYFETLREHHDTAAVQARVEAALKRRFAVLGTVVAVLALFGGSAIFAASIQTLIRAPVNKQLEAAQAQRDLLVEARTNAQNELEALQNARARIDDVVIRAQAFKQTMEGDLEIVREEVAGLQDAAARAKTVARDASAKLPGLGEELRQTKRQIIRNLALMHVNLERNERITEVVSNLVLKIGDTSTASDVVAASAEARDALLSTLTEFDAKVGALEERWSFNIVLYGIEKTDALKRMKQQLEAKAYLPEVWKTPTQTERSGVAEEIASEFGIAANDLLAHDNAVVFRDTPQTRAVAEEIAAELNTVSAANFALLPLPIEPEPKHRRSFGRGYTEDQVVLVSVLPPTELALQIR